MDFGPATWWWVAAGVVIALELATGTFYMLLLALGLIAAGLAALAGLGLPTQLVIAALVGGGSVALGIYRSTREPPPPPAGANPDVMLDIGERVMVSSWGPDGQARVSYRGATWTARYVGSDEPGPGVHHIQAVDGNRLLLVR